MTLNLINIGNSKGVIFTKDILNKLNVSEKDKLNYEFDDEKLIISKKSISKTKPVVSAELLSWLDSFNKRYKSALTELASK